MEPIRFLAHHVEDFAMDLFPSSEGQVIVDTMTSCGWILPSCDRAS